MSDIGLFSNLGHDVATWAAVTFLLGGPAAIAAGRALARGWRGLSRALAHAALLAAAANFLCYALFDVSALPIYAVFAALRDGAILDVATRCSVWAATFVILFAVESVAWRVTRARQMREQYPFLEAVE